MAQLLPMTDEEYVAKEGERCPYCGSPRIEATAEDFGIGDDSFYIYCWDCKKSHRAAYKLVGWLPPLPSPFI
jgi:hypothetical protein